MIQQEKFHKIVNDELGKIAAYYCETHGLPFENFMEKIETMSFKDRVLFVANFNMKHAKSI